MDVQEYDRRAFSVNAVEVTMQNVQEVAEWCGGTVGEVKTKLVGAWTMLPMIELNGSGESKGRVFKALLGHYVVELNGSFRVYKPQTFRALFVKKELKDLEEKLLNEPDDSPIYETDGSPDTVRDATDGVYQDDSYTQIEPEIETLTPEQLQSKL